MQTLMYPPTPRTGRQPAAAIAESRAIADVTPEYRLPARGQQIVAGFGLPRLFPSVARRLGEIYDSLSQVELGHLRTTGYPFDSLAVGVASREIHVGKIAGARSTSSTRLTRSKISGHSIAEIWRMLVMMLRTVTFISA